MSRHRVPATSRLPRLLVAPAAGALAVGFLSVLMPPTAFAADKDCGDFASQADAQAFFVGNGGSATNNIDNLDADNDGLACENFTYVVSTAPQDDADQPVPADAPQGGVEAGDGSDSGLFRLF